MQHSEPPLVLNEMVMQWYLKLGGRGHVESSPRPSEGGVSLYHVLRPLITGVCTASGNETGKGVDRKPASQ